MPVSNVPFYPQSLTMAACLLNNALGTGKVTLRTGSTNGDKIESISVTSTDTVAQVLNVILTISAVDYQIGTVNVPAGCGTDAGVTGAVSLLEPTGNMPWIRQDSNGRPYLYLAPSAVLALSSQVAVTAAKQINAVATIGVF